MFGSLKTPIRWKVDQRLVSLVASLTMNAESQTRPLILRTAGHVAPWEDTDMLIKDEIATVPYMSLAPESRLNRVDFLAKTISDLAFDVAGIGDPNRN